MANIFKTSKIYLSNTITLSLLGVSLVSGSLNNNFTVNAEAEPNKNPQASQVSEPKVGSDVAEQKASTESPVSENTTPATTTENTPSQPTTCQPNQFLAEYFNMDKEDKNGRSKWQTDDLYYNPVLATECLDKLDLVAWNINPFNKATQGDFFSSRFTGDFNLTPGEYEFSIVGDDILKLYIDNNLVGTTVWQDITNWKERKGGKKVKVKITNPTTNIRVEHKDGIGAAVVKVVWERVGGAEGVINPNYPTTCQPNQFLAEYFNMDKEDKNGRSKWQTDDLYYNQVLATECLDKLDLVAWNINPFNKATQGDFFSSRFTGDFNLTPGEYEFSIVGDDILKLYIDNNLVGTTVWQDITNWKERKGGKKVKVKITNPTTNIRVEHKDGIGAAVVKVVWERVGGAEGVINPNYPELYEKVKKEGKVNLIVQLKTDYADPDLKNKQDEVLATLGNPENVVKFELTQGFAVSVDKNDFGKLDQNTDKVTFISENSGDEPSLSESIKTIQADKVHSPLTSTNPATGQGTTIAIIDTGVDHNHPFLQGKMVQEFCFSGNGGTFVGQSTCPAGVGFSAAPGSGLHCSLAIDPVCDHGTHVAGIALGKNGPAGINGVAPDAKLLAVQASSYFPVNNGIRARLYVADQILSLDRLFALKSGNVVPDLVAVNMSFGGGNNPAACLADPRRAAVVALKNIGVATIAGTGNGGFNNGISAPACIPEVIAVGSVDKVFSSESAFSNVSNSIDLYAPGSGQGGGIQSSVPGGLYAFQQGTSMATSHVAGSFALLRSLSPASSVDEILDALSQTGRPVTSKNPGVIRPTINNCRAANQLLANPSAVWCNLISGVLWDDLNANGIRDAGEPPLDNVIVQLRDIPNSNLIASTTTGQEIALNGGFVSGGYKFLNLPDGNYNLVVVRPQGKSLTFADQGNDDTVDSDFDTSTGVSTTAFVFQTSDANFRNRDAIFTNVDAGLVTDNIDLTSEVLIDKNQVREGEWVKITLKVTNNGTSPASNVVANFPWNNLLYIQRDSSGGNRFFDGLTETLGDYIPAQYNPTTGQWNIPGISLPGQTLELEIFASANFGTEGQVGDFQIPSLTLTQVDTNPLNNASNVVQIQVVKPLVVQPNYSSIGGRTEFNFDQDGEGFYGGGFWHLTDACEAINPEVQGETPKYWSYSKPNCGNFNLEVNGANLRNGGILYTPVLKAPVDPNQRIKFTLKYYLDRETNALLCFDIANVKIKKYGDPLASAITLVQGDQNCNGSNFRTLIDTPGIGWREITFQAPVGLFANEEYQILFDFETRDGEFNSFKNDDDPTPVYGWSVDNFTISPSLVGGKVWKEGGTIDNIFSGADQSLGGIQVQLLDANNNIVQQTTSNAQGNYVFENIDIVNNQYLPINYKIKFILPNGAVPVVKNFGNDFTVDSDINPNGETDLINFVTYQGNLAIDAGLIVDPTNLSITKTSDKDQYATGETVTYKITAENLGPSNATNVKLDDVLDPNLTFVSSTCNKTNNTYDFGDINVGKTKDCEIKATVNANVADQTIIPNVTSNLVLDQTDTDNTNDVGSKDIVVILPGVDIAINKTSDKDEYAPGETVTYTISATNNGPNISGGIEIADILDSNLELVSSTCLGYLVSQVFDIQGPINVNETKSCEIKAKIKNSTPPNTVIPNVAILHSTSSVRDINFSNNRGSKDIKVVSQDIDIEILETTFSKNPANPGDTITAKLRLRNNSTVVATNLKIDYQFGAGLIDPGTPLSLVSSNVNATELNGSFFIPQLDNQIIAEIEYSFVVGSQNTLPIQYSVIGIYSGADQTDTDSSNDIKTSQITIESGASSSSSSVSSNNSSSSSSSQPTTNLTVTKTSDKDEYQPDETVTYTITVENKGPVDATNVTVDDVLNGNLQFTSSTCPKNGNTYSFGTIPVGQTKDCIIVAKLVDASTIVLCPSAPNGQEPIRTILNSYSPDGGVTTYNNKVCYEYASAAHLPVFDVNGNLDLDKLLGIDDGSIACPTPMRARKGYCRIASDINKDKVVDIWTNMSPYLNDGVIIPNKTSNLKLDQQDTDPADDIGSKDIKIVIPNLPPVAVDTNVELESDNSIEIDLSSLVTDSDGTVDFSTLEIVTNPTQGSIVSIVGSKLTYKANLTFVEKNDFITLKVKDNKGAVSNEFKINIKIKFTLITCPNGTTNDGQNNCIAPKICTPDSQGPVDNNGNCTQPTQVQAGWNCPAGWTNDNNGNCSLVQQQQTGTNYTCPNGGELQGTNCVATPNSYIKATNCIIPGSQLSTNGEACVFTFNLVNSGYIYLISNNCNGSNTMHLFQYTNFGNHILCSQVVGASGTLSTILYLNRYYNNYSYPATATPVYGNVTVNQPATPVFQAVNNPVPAICDPNTPAQNPNYTDIKFCKV